MSKIIALIIPAVLVLVAITTLNFSPVNAGQQTDFIQVSVLAENRADYGVDNEVVSMPVISLDIIEDKVHDLQETSSVPVIIYTTLPEKEKDLGGGNEVETGSGKPPKSSKDHNNGNNIRNERGNNSNNGNGASQNTTNGNSGNSGVSGDTESNSGTSGASGNPGSGSNGTPANSGSNRDKGDRTNKGDEQPNKAEKLK